MKKEFFKINNIPAVLWGETSEKIIIAVHGNMSHKEDIPIEILAEIGNQKNYQILSFDLPEHGERKNEKNVKKLLTGEYFGARISLASAVRKHQRQTTTYGEISKWS